MTTRPQSNDTKISDNGLGRPVSNQDNANRPRSQELRTSKENWQNPKALKINQIVPDEHVLEQMMKKEEKKPFFADGDKLSRLEKYEEVDNHDPLNKPFVPYQGFKGPKQDRTPTDSGWIYLFLVLYGIFIFYTYLTVTQGKPERLANGIDFRGEVCGEGGLSTRQYLYWASPLVDVNVAWCVRQCPPSSGTEICMYDTDHVKMTPFCYLRMQCDQMGTFCVPKEPQNRAAVMNYLGSTRNTIKRISADLYLCWDIVLAALVFCVFLSYLFTIMATCKSIVKGLIWSGVFGSVVAFLVFAWLCWLEAERARRFNCIDGTDPSTCGGPKENLFRILTVVFIVVGIVYFVIVMILRTRLNRGAELIKHAQHIMEVLSQIRIYPFIVTIIGTSICGLVFWLVINAMTIGDLELVRAQNIDGHLVWKLIPSDPMQYMLIYALLILVFSLVLILVMNDMLTSYALSVWFFTKQKDTVKIPLGFVIKTLYRYHFGTCVFITCNLIFLSIPKILMSTLRVILSKNKISLLQGTYPNRAILSVICKPAVWDVYIYISKNTVVQVAVWSEPYYECAKRSYFLLFRNMSKVRDLDLIQSLVVIQLQLCTSLIAAIPVYIYIDRMNSTPYGNQTALIETPLIPTAFVFLVGLFFTAVFQGQYDITCKTIIQLYLMDNEMFFGEQRFVEDFIREFMEFEAEEEQQHVQLPQKPKNEEEDDEEEEDEDDSQEKASENSDPDIDYNEKLGNQPAIGDPIEDTVRPSGQYNKKYNEELGSVSKQTKTKTESTVQLNGTKTDLYDKNQILNTSHANSFKNIQGVGDISNISDVSVGEPQQRKNKLKI